MWYFAREGSQEGPVSDEQMQEMVRDGSLRPDHLVWREGMPEWRPAREVPGLVFGSQGNQGNQLPHELPTMPIAVVPPPPSPPSQARAPEPPSYQPPPPQPSTMAAGSDGPGAPASPYTPPQAPLGPGMGGMGVNVPNYLPWAIVATLFCCLPAGIVSIVFASRANSAAAMGDYATAQRAAANAKTWLWVSVGASLLVIVLYVVMIGVGGVLGTLQQ